MRPPATLSPPMKLLAAISSLAVLAVAPVAGAHGEASRCLSVKPALTKVLRAGVKSSLRARLGTPKAVKTTARLRKAPSGLAKGAWFVSVPVRGRGTATWIVNESAFRTGGGVILPVGSLARSVSVFGSALSPAVVSSWGITTRTDGYAASRDCV